MTSNRISAIITYVMWRGEHLWNVKFPNLFFEGVEDSPPLVFLYRQEVAA
jgi:hypothetical protein